MKKIIVASALALGLGFSSCNSYLDINTDPNSPAEENIETYMLMPVIEMNMASSYGNFLRIAGGFHAQQYAHLFGTSNYVDYSQFNMSATRSSGTYTQFNQKALSNLKTLMNKSAAEEDWGTYLAGTVLKAFVYEALVDCYGEVPYTEAMDLDNYPTPKYDDGQTVYEGGDCRDQRSFGKCGCFESCLYELPFPVGNGWQVDSVCECIEIKNADAYVYGEGCEV